MSGSLCSPFLQHEAPALKSDQREQHLEPFDRGSFEHLVNYVAKTPDAEGLIAYAELRFGREVQQISTAAYDFICVDALSMSRPL